MRGQLQALADPHSPQYPLDRRLGGLQQLFWTLCGIEQNPSFFHDSNIRLPGRRLVPVAIELPPGQIYSCKLIITTFSSPGTTQPIVGVYFRALYRALASSRTRLLDHTRRATVGRTPLNEWSVRRRDLYQTTHNIHNRQTSMPRVGFEPTIAAGERP